MLKQIHSGLIAIKDKPFCILTFVFTCASAQVDSGNIIHSGQATYYAATGDGNCMFGPSPGDLMVVAMNNTEYDSSSVCGASIRVKGRLGEITVRIVDRCPECPVGNIDLSKEAFAKIDDTIRGRVPVTWWYVESQVTGPIKYRIKTGSNAWWIGVQILNHRTPIARVEALLKGAWVTIPRMNYNYFVYASGLGAGPFTFRVTDFYGQQLTDTNIPLAPDVITNGQANFTSLSPVVIQRALGSSLRTTTTVKIIPISRSYDLRGLRQGEYELFSVQGSFLGKVHFAGETMSTMGKTWGNGVVIVKQKNIARP
jgi:expansin (peptidoglycan-binding protein)